MITGATGLAVGVDSALWGKRDPSVGGYPLLCHLLDTSASALVLWDQWLRPGLRRMIADLLTDGDLLQARSLVAAVAGLHDIGKVNKVFQGQLFNSRMNAADKASFALVSEALSESGYDMSAPTGKFAGRPFPEAYKAILRRHEAVGMFALTNRWPAATDTPADAWAATIIGGHHGRFHPKNSTNESLPADPGTATGFLSGLTAGVWGDQQSAHREAVLAATGVSWGQLTQQLSTPTSSAVLILLTGLVMLADWLASDDTAVSTGRACTADPVKDPARWVQERSTHFAAQLGETLGVYTDVVDPVAAIMGEHQANLSPLQKAARGVGRGLWIATETTGAGKTEAAVLRHMAVSGEGLMFALPTRATTDAMFDRISAFYASSTNAASLLHGHRTLNAFYATESSSTESSPLGLHSTSWLTDTRNALFAPIAVGTCDQVLLGALKQKNTPVRLLALANRHVVIDEVHSFDHYQSALLEELLTWWGATDTRVTLLSASLPAAVTDRYIQAYGNPNADTVTDSVPTVSGEPERPGTHVHYPGHITVTQAETGSTVVSEAVCSQRSYTLGVALHQSSVADLVARHTGLALAYRAAFPNARIAVVVNQVDRAIAIGRLLTQSGHRTLVLHSRMAAGHRTAVARELHDVAGKNSVDGGVFVVGTQLLESSLDLDFDHMITDLAPAPALIQRAGRLWRSTAVVDNVWGAHRRPRPSNTPLLDVIATVSGDGSLAAGAGLPYLPGELARTIQALTSQPESSDPQRLTHHLVRIPEDVQQFVDAAAFDPYDPGALTENPADALELIRAGRKLMSANSVVVPFHPKHGSEALLRRRATFRDFAAITERDELADSATRMVERPTVDCFLVDPETTSPWVWRGTIDTALYSRDRNITRSVLRLTFPLAESKLASGIGIEKIPGFDTDASIRRRGALQRKLVPVRLTAEGRYDDILGLLLPPPRRLLSPSTPADSAVSVSERCADAPK